MPWLPSGWFPTGTTEDGGGEEPLPTGTIDTAAKRWQMLGVIRPRHLPLPNGSINANDRALLLGQYQMASFVEAVPGGWPTVAEIYTRLTEMGLTPPSDATLLALRNAAIGAWENATGFHPFLAEAEASTWNFVPRGGQLLDFAADGGPGGFVALTSVTFDVTYAYPTGNAQVLGRDYTPQPFNNPARNRAYWYLKTCGYLPEEFEASVEIVGRAGGAALVTPEVFAAVLDESIRRVQALSASGVGAAQKIRQGELSIDYGSGSSALAFSQSLLSTFAQGAVSAWRRPRIG